MSKRIHRPENPPPKVMHYHLAVVFGGKEHFIHKVGENTFVFSDNIDKATSWTCKAVALQDIGLLLKEYRHISIRAEDQ